VSKSKRIKLLEQRLLAMESRHKIVVDCLIKQDLLPGFVDIRASARAALSDYAKIYRFHAATDDCA
jgi:hypothetical protein